ncbi:MAG TPA: hypothetical protein VN853_12340, partial [Polyangia bacterium]|nr:hypothetical protein [Polyangia bacterium]
LHINNVTGADDRFTNLQVFGAALYLFYKQLYVKLVVGYAKSHFEDNKGTPYDDDQFSARLRVMYLY